MIKYIQEKKSSKWRLILRNLKMKCFESISKIDLIKTYNKKISTFFLVFSELQLMASLLATSLNPDYVVIRNILKLFYFPSISMISYDIQLMIISVYMVLCLFLFFKQLSTQCGILYEKMFSEITYCHNQLMYYYINFICFASIFQCENYSIYGNDEKVMYLIIIIVSHCLIAFNVLYSIIIDRLYFQQNMNDPYCKYNSKETLIFIILKLIYSILDNANLIHNMWILYTIVGCLQIIRIALIIYGAVYLYFYIFKIKIIVCISTLGIAGYCIKNQGEFNIDDLVYAIILIISLYKIVYFYIFIKYDKIYKKPMTDLSNDLECVIQFYMWNNALEYGLGLADTYGDRFRDELYAKGILSNVHNQKISCLPHNHEFNKHKYTIYLLEEYIKKYPHSYILKILALNYFLDKEDCIQKSVVLLANISNYELDNNSFFIQLQLYKMKMLSNMRSNIFIIMENNLDKSSHTKELNILKFKEWIYCNEAINKFHDILINQCLDIKDLWEEFNNDVIDIYRFLIQGSNILINNENIIKNWNILSKYFTKSANNDINYNNNNILHLLYIYGIYAIYNLVGMNFIMKTNEIMKIFNNMCNQDIIKDNNNNDMNDFIIENHNIINNINSDVNNDVKALYKESVYLIISAQNKDLGHILSCSYNINDIIGYYQQDLINENIDKILPQIYRYNHNSYLKRCIDTGDFNALHRILQTFYLKKNNFNAPCVIKIILDNHIKYGLCFIGLMKPINTPDLYIIMDDKGNIDSFSHGFLNIQYNDNNYPTHISQICKDFDKVQEAFNYITHNLYDNNGQIKANKEYLKASHEEYLHIYQNFTAGDILQFKFSKIYNKHTFNINTLNLKTNNLNQTTLQSLSSHEPIDMISFCCSIKDNIITNINIPHSNNSIIGNKLKIARIIRLKAVNNQDKELINYLTNKSDTNTHVYQQSSSANEIIINNNNSHHLYTIMDQIEECSDELSNNPFRLDSDYAQKPFSSPERITNIRLSTMNNNNIFTNTNSNSKFQLKHESSQKHTPTHMQTLMPTHIPTVFSFTSERNSFISKNQQQHINLNNLNHQVNTTEEILFENGNGVNIKHGLKSPKLSEKKYITDGNDDEGDYNNDMIDENCNFDHNSKQNLLQSIKSNKQYETKPSFNDTPNHKNSRRLLVNQEIKLNNKILKKTHIISSLENNIDDHNNYGSDNNNQNKNNKYTSDKISVLSQNDNYRTSKTIRKMLLIEKPSRYIILMRYILILFFLMHAIFVILENLLQNNFLQEITLNLHAITYNTQRLDYVVEINRRSRAISLINNGLISNDRHASVGIPDYRIRNQEYMYIAAINLKHVSNWLRSYLGNLIDINGQNNLLDNVTLIWNDTESGLMYQNSNIFDATSIIISEVIRVANGTNITSPSDIDLEFILNNTLDNYAIELASDSELFHNTILQNLIKINKTQYLISGSGIGTIAIGICIVLYIQKKLNDDKEEMLLLFTKLKPIEIKMIIKRVDILNNYMKFTKFNYEIMQSFLGKIKRIEKTLYFNSDSSRKINKKPLFKTKFYMRPLKQSFKILSVFLFMIFFYVIQAAFFENFTHHCTDSISMIIHTYQSLTNQGLALALTYQYIQSNSSDIIQNQTINEVLLKKMNSMQHQLDFTNIYYGDIAFASELSSILQGDLCSSQLSSELALCIKIGNGAAHRGLVALNSWMYSELLNVITMFNTSNRSIEMAKLALSIQGLLDLEIGYSIMIRDTFNLLSNILLDDYRVSSDKIHYELIASIIIFLTLLPLFFWLIILNTIFEMIKDDVSSRKLLRLLPDQVFLCNTYLKRYLIKSVKDYVRLKVQPMKSFQYFKCQIAEDENPFQHAHNYLFKIRDLYIKCNFVLKRFLYIVYHSIFFAIHTNKKLSLRFFLLINHELLHFSCIMYIICIISYFVQGRKEDTSLYRVKPLGS